MAVKKFPKEILVTIEEGEDEPYLVAYYSENVGDVDNGRKVGVYQLESVKTVVKTTEVK